MSEISGTTRLVHVVADPVFQLKTPQALNAIWRSRNEDVVTVPAHVAGTGLASFIEALRATQNTVGAVVTVPHKQAVLPLLDELGPIAHLTGAVNAIRRAGDGRLIGETFDGLGFVAGLKGAGIDPAGNRVVIFGAGGAAASVAAALAQAGAESIVVENRSAERAEALAARLRKAGYAADFRPLRHPAVDGAHLLVNATSIGMRPGDRPDFALERFGPEAVAADVVVSAVTTPFLSDAAGVGMRTHEGRHMLAGQMQLIADFLTGGDRGPVANE